MNGIGCAYGSQWKQWLAAMAATLAMINVGNEEFWILQTLRTVAVTDQGIKEHMYFVWAGFFIATTSSVIGAILGAVLADKFGRRQTLLVSSILAIIQTVGSFSISTVWSCVPLFLGEIGLGMTCVVVPLYVSEIADDKIRGALMMLQVPFFYCGKLIAVGIGLSQSSEILYILSVLFVGIFIVAFTWLPETPYYLASTKRYETAAKSLAFYRSIKNVAVEDEVQMIIKDVEPEANGRSQGYCQKIQELVRGTNGKGLIIVIFLIIAKWSEQRLDSGNNLAHVVSGTLVSSTYHAKMIAHLTSLITSILIVFTIDVIGRRSFLLYATFISFTSVIISLIFRGNTECQWVYYGIGIIFHCCQLIICSIPLVYVGELFSTNVKALAISVVTIFNLLTSFVIISLFGILQTDVNSYILGVVLLFAFPITLAFIPETKQKTLLDIQSEVNATTLHCRWLRNILVRTDRT